MKSKVFWVIVLANVTVHFFLKRLVSWVLTAHGFFKQNKIKHKKEEKEHLK